MTRTISPLKAWPIYFEAIVLGRKTFEIRRNDRYFQEGDRVTLLEWDPGTGKYTGREIMIEIRYVCDLGPVGLHGYVGMSIVPMADGMG